MKSIQTARNVRGKEKEGHNLGYQCVSYAKINIELILGISLAGEIESTKVVTRLVVKNL